ncbi:MAG: (2Fe-2S)-binding protein [Gemmatimonadetes bacterium]|nr:(2Fe-2S)-binding protein [Gemmatimonadota bacterium]
MPVSLTLNGKPVTLDTGDDRRLLWVLRDDLGLTGSKFGCGIGACGACTVLIDGKATRSCITELKAVAGKKVTTIEGLATGDKLAPVQEAFLDHLGFQCGYCTSGMIMTGQSILNANPKATREQVAAGLERNFCRCGAQVRIIDAIADAAKAPTAGAQK